MNDWFRSLTVLGAGFASVVAFTIGMSLVIVAAPAASSQGTNGNLHDDSGTGQRPDDGVPGTGGTLTVSGDRSGALILDSSPPGESIGTAEPRFGLAGDDGRIFFTRIPLVVEQVNYDGLSFYPDPDQCTITPGDLEDTVDIGPAELRCDALEDVRGDGVIDIEGTVNLPLDLLVPRELPPSGGSVEVGDEAWEFTDAVLFIGLETEHTLTLFDIAPVVDLDWQQKSLRFTYDSGTGRLNLASVERSGEALDVPDDACDLTTEELGELDEQITVFELSIQCPEVDVPELGSVSITGTVIFDRNEFVTTTDE